MIWTTLVEGNRNNKLEQISNFILSFMIEATLSPGLKLQLLLSWLSLGLWQLSSKYPFNLLKKKNNAYVYVYINLGTGSYHIQLASPLIEDIFITHLGEKITSADASIGDLRILLPRMFRTVISRDSSALTAAAGR